MALRNQIAAGLALLLACACASPKVGDSDIIRPAPGEPFLEELPGPLLGPFDGYSNALLAACNKIITKPNAVAGSRSDQDFNTFWRSSKEYCAWIYYTPDKKYMISRLTDQSEPDPALRLKSCILPSTVKDSRYPTGSIEYIYAVHNHPWDSTLSERDIHFIVSAGTKHGFESATKDGDLRLSIVAFFSRSVSAPTCDGFHQYIPITGQVLKWSKDQGAWSCEQTGLVSWNEQGTAFSFKQLKAPCVNRNAP
jgi:hypothetical protein